MTDIQATDRPGPSDDDLHDLPVALRDPVDIPRRYRPPLFFATDRAIDGMTADDIERFFRSVEEDPQTGCWLWQGYVAPSGYGSMSVRNIAVRVHRIIYWLTEGPLSHKFEVDHLCGNRRCVNPTHLEAVSHAENVRRGRAGSFWAAKTACPQGHPYEGGNLRRTRAGGRACKACAAERARKRRAARKAHEQG